MKIPLPPIALVEGNYVVVRVLAVRDTWISPRAVDVHLATQQGRTHIVGVRH